MKPERLQRRRVKGYRLPPGTVCVTRKTKWGNPYRGPNAAEQYRTTLATWSPQSGTPPRGKTTARRIRHRTPPIQTSRFLDMIEKPPYTTPCNHRGLCCRLEVCEAGRMLTQLPAPCPFIIMDGEKTLCGLVLMEQAITPNKPYVAAKLAIGYGCTMSDEETTWETKVEFLDRTSAHIGRLERNINRRPYGKPSLTIRSLPWTP